MTKPSSSPADHKIVLLLVPIGEEEEDDEEGIALLLFKMPPMILDALPLTIEVDDEEVLPCLAQYTLEEARVSKCHSRTVPSAPAVTISGLFLSLLLLKDDPIDKILLQCPRASSGFMLPIGPAGLSAKQSPPLSTFPTLNVGPPALAAKIFEEKDDDAAGDDV